MPSCCGAPTWRRCTILWTRVTDRRLSAQRPRWPCSTFEHRSYELADLTLTFTPQTDLAILNYIANYIIQTKRVNRDFVDKHTVFHEGNADIGYGLRPDHPLQKAAKNADKAGGSRPITYDEFAKFVSKYDLDYTSKLSGVPKKQLQDLAELYADPKIRVSSTGPWASATSTHARRVGRCCMRSTTSTCSRARSPPRETARSRSPASLPPVAPRARWARSRTGCPPT